MVSQNTAAREFRAEARLGCALLERAEIAALSLTLHRFYLASVPFLTAKTMHYKRHHLMLQLMPMRTTLALDDDLVRKAQEFTGVAEKTALIREALKALIERESARRLASLGGTMRELKNIPRRRSRS